MSKKIPLFTHFVFNLASLVRKGFANWVAKSKDPSKKIQEAIILLLSDKVAKSKAKEFSKIMETWDGPKLAANLLYNKFGKRRNKTSLIEAIQV